MTIQKITADHWAKALWRTHPSIIQTQTGQRFCAYRAEYEPLNQRTRTRVCAMNENWQPAYGTDMALDAIVDRNRQRMIIAEDCRLFHCNDQIYYALTNRENLYLGHLIECESALLDAGCAILAFPFEEGSIEKNWGFFEHDGDLYGVRWVHQHVVHKIHVDFHDGHAVYPATCHDYVLNWDYGRPHGGTSPVKFGTDNYMSIFHSSRLEGSSKVYRAGVYIFEAAPPFRITHVPNKPLIDASEWPAGFNGHKTVFPLSVVWDRADCWSVSYGDDRDMYIANFSSDELLASVDPV